MHELSVGAEVSGRYTLLEALPDAPFGARWRVSDARGPGGRLTVIRPPRALGSAERARLLDAMRRFSHPYAVPVSDAGVVDDCPYVVTPGAEGQGLRAWLAELRAGGSSMALRDARALVEQVAQLLAAAHRVVDEVALVHGASLAESALVERRGTTQFVVHVDDLGQAALRAEVSAHAAPGATAEGPSAQDDVFGLGVLLAEVLTGEVFDARAEHAIACAKLARARAEVHPTVWAVVRACTEPSAARRPDGVARVRELLRQAVWTPGEVRVARKTAPPPPPPPPTAPLPPERARVVAVNVSVVAPPRPVAVEVEPDLSTRPSLPPIVLEAPPRDEETGKLLSLSEDAVAAVQPDEATATLRVKRSLLNAEKTEVSAPLSVEPARASRSLLLEEKTRVIDGDAMAPDAPIDTLNTEHQPHRASLARRSTYMPVGGPDAGPSAPSPPRRRGATLRDARPPVHVKSTPAVARDETAAVDIASLPGSALAARSQTVLPVGGPDAQYAATPFDAVIEPTSPSIIPGEIFPEQRTDPGPASQGAWEQTTERASVSSPPIVPVTPPPPMPLPPAPDATIGLPRWLIALGISLVVFLALLAVSSAR